METVATVLYARLRNMLPVCNAMGQGADAEFVEELRGTLQKPVAKQNGVLAQIRPDSILAIFANEPETRPDHARRALQAALLIVYQAAELNQRLHAEMDAEGLVPLAVSVGAHMGRVEIEPARPGNSGAVRASGDAVEIARALECTSPDIGWSIVASDATRRAAGNRVESGRIGSVRLPDSSFVDIVEVTGLAPRKNSRTAPEVYQALRDSVLSNQRCVVSPDPVGTSDPAARNGAVPFSIQDYRVMRKIGEGGMASIYLAQAGEGDELQVLKVMSLGGSGEDDTLQRFMQEFALLAQVRHPNVATIYRQGFSAGHAYIAMEYFPHGDLRSRIAAGLSSETAISYSKQIAAALHEIHRVDIVHRDLKPDNLMLRADGSLALGDFGIAKHLSMQITDTLHGSVVGTPYYLSPEQAAGQPVDRRCDIYCLGLIFYEMLTGARPYRAQTAAQLLDLHVNGPVPLLRPPHDRLQPVLERLMAKDRDRRYADTGQFLNELAGLGL
ncbi:MAG TPA: protein kinase [Burkholderiales bacterium]|nr:protein kinase [Burkholderiales bacterium]